MVRNLLLTGTAAVVAPGVSIASCSAKSSAALKGNINHSVCRWTYNHLSVEELWNKVREQDTKVSVATVYRTMKLLNECGLAHARNFGDGPQMRGTHAACSASAASAAS